MIMFVASNQQGLYFTNCALLRSECPDEWKDEIDSHDATTCASEDFLREFEPAELAIAIQ